MRRQLLAETIGTFCLVFAGTGAIVINDLQGHAITHAGIAITFGLIVMTMIYSIGDISGAHINPSATLGFWAAGRFPGNRVIPYVAAQALGAVTASVTLHFLFPEHGTLGATLPAGSASQSFILEVLLTFMLLFLVLNITTGAEQKGWFAGMAIGGMVALEAMFAGPVCGASMNPVRSLGPALVSGHMASLWIYLTAPPLGTLLAVVVQRILRPAGSDEL